MTVENSLTHGLKTSLLGSAYKTEYDANLTLLDKNRVSVGTFVNRPVAGIAERFYYASDTNDLYYDNGTTWLSVAATTATAHASTHASAGSDAVVLEQTQVIGLATALTGKANSAHAHPESEITNLVADLAGKSPTTHNHTGVYEPANTGIQSHLIDIANPHSVTASQAGAEPANANIQNHIADVANPHTVTKAQVGLTNVQDTKVNLTATVAPTATDDSASGYTVGSTWIDVTADKTYKCVDSTVGSAIWLEIGSIIPAFRVSTATPTTLPQYTETKIILDDSSAGDNFDSNNNFDTTLYRFKPTVAGKYLLQAGVNLNAVTTNAYMAVHIFKNGAIGSNAWSTSITHGAYAQQLGASIFELFTANGTTDYFEVFAYQGFKQPLDSILSIFTGFRIGGV